LVRSSDQPKQFEYLGSDIEPGRIYFKTVNRDLVQNGDVYLTIAAKYLTAIPRG
jgi:hypothetical protein